MESLVPKEGGQARRDSEMSSRRQGKGPLRQLWFRAVIYLIVAYIAWCVLLYFWQDRLVFPRHFTPAPRPSLYNADTVAMRLETETGGHVESWFIPARGASAEAPGPCAVFFHGNAEIIDYLDDIIERYHSLGCSVLLLEYRGYGRSDGKPSERAIRADSVRFYDELIKRPDVDRSRIVFHGRSLGGNAAVNLAVERRPVALILQSVPKSAACMAYRFGAPPILVRHPFRTDRAIAGMKFPILIFHGSHDEIISVAHGRNLHALAPHAEYVEFPCGHNDFPGWGNDSAYWAAIQAFLARNGIISG